jgi:hypothetical protein
MALAWHTWGGVVLAFTASLPFWALLVWSRARCPRGATGRGVSRWRWRRPLAEIGMVAGSLPWVWMVMTPVPGEGGVRPVPLVDLYEVLHRSPGTATVQVVGNLLVFASLGFFLPIRWRLGVIEVGLVGCAGSIMIETAQWVLDLGRVSSADDVVLNSLGAALAALLSRRWWLRQESTAQI